MAKVKAFLIHYMWNVLIAIDQLCNAILLGDPDETISSRLGKHLIKRPGCPFCSLVCKFLNLFEKNHCIGAIEEDEGKDDLVDKL
jgi:hypothetical protein